MSAGQVNSELEKNPSNAKKCQEEKIIGQVEKIRGPRVKPPRLPSLKLGASFAGQVPADILDYSV
jgi:hypothetical protein